MGAGQAFLHRRTAGVLLHVTSLPSGDLGPDAFRFADLLAEAGQSAWQVMPLGPPGAGRSPYAAHSAFAGDPGLISVQRLADDGFLEPGDVADDRESALRAAFRRFDSSQGGAYTLDGYLRYEWVDAWARWAALREQFGPCWWEWPAAFRDHRTAWENFSPELESEARFHAFLQMMFDLQWRGLRHHTHERGITLIGDLPIFVDRDSADVWANPGLFRLDEALEPYVVAGVPPDAFSATGQRWGNPVYDWPANRADGFAWWIARARRTFELVDVVRLDHFRGFQSYWEIPGSAETAIDGTWVDGPGIELFGALEAAVGKGRFIAEDLGMITDDVRTLRDDTGYPGMAVLQFAFGDRERTFQNPHLPHNHASRIVCYTGTHDNDTSCGWFESLDGETRATFARYNGSLPASTAEATDALIRMCYASPAQTAIVPFQDILQLGTGARMNIPGVAEGNWAWQFSWDQIDPARMGWLRSLAETYARLASNA